MTKQDIAVVLTTCVAALREKWMDTEGLFRLAAGAAKIKYLKVLRRQGGARHLVLDGAEGAGHFVLDGEEVVGQLIL